MRSHDKDPTCFHIQEPLGFSTAKRVPDSKQQRTKRCTNFSWLLPSSFLIFCFAEHHGTPAGYWNVRQGGVTAVEKLAQTGPATMALNAPLRMSLARVPCSERLLRSWLGWCLMSKVRVQESKAATQALEMPLLPEYRSKIPGPCKTASSTVLNFFDRTNWDLGNFRTSRCQAVSWSRALRSLGGSTKPSVCSASSA